MNKKSFLRGFGIGVLFAAVILGISFTVRTSDSYVVSKAKELGMVYKSEQDSGIKLVEATPDASAEVTEAPDAKKKDQQGKVTEGPKATAAATPVATASVTAAPKADKTSDPQKEMEEEKKKAQKEIGQLVYPSEYWEKDWSMSGRSISCNCSIRGCICGIEAGEAGQTGDIGGGYHCK